MHTPYIRTLEKLDHLGSSARSFAVPPPRQRYYVLPHATEAARVIDLVRPAARPVTAVQAHPSRTTRTSEDGASISALLAKCFEHTRYPKSLHVSNRRNGRVRGVRLTFGFRRPRTWSRLFGNELFQPRERSEGRTDRRTQHRTHPPESGRRPMFEPIGRSQTTSPMGFGAFRRNQRR